MKLKLKEQLIRLILYPFTHVFTTKQFFTFADRYFSFTQINYYPNLNLSYSRIKKSGNTNIINILCEIMSESKVNKIECSNDVNELKKGFST